MMAGAENVTCAVQGIQHSTGFRIYNAFVLALALVFFVPSFFMWIKWRTVPYLKKRSLGLVTIIMFGYALQLIAGVVSRVFETLPCELNNMAYLLCLPYVAFPSVARLHLWVNRIRLNYVIAKSLAMSGESAIDTTNTKFYWLRFRASPIYGLLIVAVFLLPYTIIIIIAVVSACSSCSGYGQMAYMSFLIVSALTLSFVIRALYVTREVPDLFGIRKECKASYALAFLFGIPGLLLSQYDIGGFHKLDPRAFTWGAVVDIGFFLFMFITIPVQVYHAQRQSKSRVLDDPSDLAEILDTDNGYRFFQMYLATELSLENLLFYQAVKEWKLQTSHNTITEKESIRLARIIYETYITKTLFEVNVSSKVVNTLTARFTKNDCEIPLDVFDEAQDQVFQLMASSSLLRFKESAFFQLYTGEISSEDVKWVEASGMSSYVFLAQDGAVHGRGVEDLLPRKRILSLLYSMAPDT